MNGDIMPSKLAIDGIASGMFGSPSAQILPGLFLFFIIGTIVCVSTRLFTGLRAFLTRSGDHKAPHHVVIEPYWFPWLGHGTQYIHHPSPSSRSGIYAVLSKGRRYNVVTSSSLATEVLMLSSSHLDNSNVMFSLLRNTFGDRGDTKRLAQRSVDGEYWAKYCASFAAFNCAPFSANAVRNVTAMTELQIWNLISGNDSWVDQEKWERNAEVRISSQGLSSTGSFYAEAHLHTLLSEWVGHIVTIQLMGRAFAHANPDIVDDILLMESKKSLFASHLPTILLPGLLPAIHARERAITAIGEWYEATTKTLDNEDPGTKYDDLGDVPKAIWDQVRLQKTEGSSSRTAAIMILVTLWSLIADTTQLAFWLTLHICSDNTLLATVREEIDPCILTQMPQASGLAISESPRIMINADALLKRSISLTAAFCEVLRLETTPYICRDVSKDFRITEAAKNDKTGNKSLGGTYILKGGEGLLIPGSIHQKDSRYFPNPDQFHAKRFIASTDGQDQPELDMHGMRPWGRGDLIFEYGNIVQPSVLILVAALVAIWELEPADKALFNPFSGWQLPGRTQCVGVNRPSKDLRAKIWRRNRD